MLSAESVSPVKTLPLRRADYHHLAAHGAFEGQRVQLIFGTVLSMSPMGTPHANAMARLTRVFMAATPADLELRVQLPLAAGDESEPEPDFAFVGLRPFETEDHPDTAVLVVEVADSSLRLDLGPKAELYAAMGVPEYWVIDLARRSTVVHAGLKRAKYGAVHRVPWARALMSAAVSGLTVELARVFRR